MLVVDVPDSTTFTDMGQLIDKVDVLVDENTIAYGAIGDQAEMVLDIFAEPKVGGGKHVVHIAIDADTVTVEHSLICRRSGQMSDCPVLRLGRVGMVEGHWDYLLGDDEKARIEVRLENGVLLWGDAL